MTGITQLTGHISDMNAEKLGTEYFEVAWHAKGILRKAVHGLIKQNRDRTRLRRLCGTMRECAASKGRRRRSG